MFPSVSSSDPALFYYLETRMELYYFKYAPASYALTSHGGAIWKIGMLAVVLLSTTTRRLQPRRFKHYRLDPNTTTVTRKQRHYFPNRLSGHAALKVHEHNNSLVSTRLASL
ncbi:hypothetical protein BJX63DRAFT_108762 [Aspergillus granulosus]|uniref:Uncharacterized protein n=1 Tax=Aspergillus granulosus TaxID=176169 RepID=A0ABR4HP91_9EURO